MRLDLTKSHYPLIIALTLMISTPLNFGCTVDMWRWELAFSLTELNSGVNSPCPCTFFQLWYGTPWSQHASQHNGHTHMCAQQWKNHWHGSLDSLIFPLISWQNVSFTWNVWRETPEDNFTSLTGVASSGGYKCFVVKKREENQNCFRFWTC